MHIVTKLIYGIEVPYSVLLIKNVIEIAMMGQKLTFAGLILFIYLLDFVFPHLDDLGLPL